MVLGRVGLTEASAGAPPKPARDARLHLDTGDAVLSGGGTALTLVGLLTHPATKTVPAAGLDPAGIRWGLDRRALAAPQSGALASSNLLFVAAVGYPVVATALAPGSRRLLAAEEWTLRDEAEAGLLAAGFTHVIKDLISRPRPFTYRAPDALPDNSFYDPRAKDSFGSFPSGHASGAWAGAMVAVGTLAERRPELPPAVHVLNGALAGGLATATSLLRVDAQAHFPTDVAAGAAIGSGAGLVATLLHAGPPPAGAHRGRAWRYELAGLGAGIALGFLFTPPTSPWVR
jgi:membrane-associated phospholipid phosphatase